MNRTRWTRATFTVLGVCLLAQLLSGVTFGQDRQQAFQNWSDVYGRIDVAVWAENPLEVLEEIRQEVQSNGLEYLFDPLNRLNRAVAFISNMPDSTRVLYEQERAFRAIVSLDTVFTIAEMELTGDGLKDKVLGRVSKRGNEVTGRVTVVSAQDSHRVVEFDATVPEGWSGFSELRTYFYTAIDVLSVTRFGDPKEDVFISIALGSLEYLSAEPRDVLKAQLEQYLETFQGKTISFGYGGGYGGIYMWYEPLQAFITVYVS